MEPERALKWTRRALSDLASIISFIATDKPLAARKLAQAIKAHTETLGSVPKLGREVTPGIRELVVHRHYLITYRVMPDRIEILQVWHTARKH